MTSKIRIRMGAIEVEYEGSEAFLKDELPDLLSAVSKLYRESGAAGADANLDLNADTGAGSFATGTTGGIAAKLGCTSGSDLIIAAAAKLALIDKQQSFPRKTLHEEMKTASSYYNKNYGPNLSKYLTALVKAGRLNEPAKDRYSLSPAERQKIEPKIAG